VTAQQEQQQQPQRHAESKDTTATATADAASITSITSTTTATATTARNDAVDAARTQSAVQQQQQQQQRSHCEAAPCTRVPLLLQAPSLLCFLSIYMEQQRPVVIRGAMQHWPALQQWHNFNYLKFKAGFRTVPVEVSNLDHC
jgi:Cupin-like domain